MPEGDKVQGRRFLKKSYPPPSSQRRGLTRLSVSLRPQGTRILKRREFSRFLGIAALFRPQTGAKLLDVIFHN